MFTWSFWCSKQHLRSGAPLANLARSYIYNIVTITKEGNFELVTIEFSIGIES